MTHASSDLHWESSQVVRHIYRSFASFTPTLIDTEASQLATKHLILFLWIVVSHDLKRCLREVQLIQMVLCEYCTAAICDSEWLVIPTESDHQLITMVHLRNLSYSHECWFTNTLGPRIPIRDWRSIPKLTSRKRMWSFVYPKVISLDWRMGYCNCGGYILITLLRIRPQTGSEALDPRLSRELHPYPLEASSPPWVCSEPVYSSHSLSISTEHDSH